MAASEALSSDRNWKIQLAIGVGGQNVALQHEFLKFKAN